MVAIELETRAELIAKLNRIRAELKVLELDGKTEENCEEARLLEDQADEVMDVLDMERIEARLNDPNRELVPIEKVAEELGFL